MKIIFSLLFFVIAANCFSQETTLPADSGKIEFKKQAQSYTPDYSDAYRILSNQVKQDPGNAELRYFLGYAIDRLNASDGDGIHRLDKEKTFEASSQFEEVIRLEPVYKGEIIILDPYAKIASIWGSLAMSYLNRNKMDSATWAFNEGKKRGGFIEPILEFNRQLLNSCASNSILVVLGDNVTIPIWYLQTMEGVRTDITLVDANLLNSAWYPKYLKSVRKLEMDLSDRQIDTMDYLLWEPRTIEITNPGNNSKKFSWEMRPTYMEDYVLKGDRIMMEIFRKNFFKRPFYFLGDSDSTFNIFLTPYLWDEGLVSRVRERPFNYRTDTIQMLKNLNSYNIDKLKKEDMAKSNELINLLNNYRRAYLSAITFSLIQLNAARVLELTSQVTTKFSKEKLPYLSEAQERYYEDFYKRMKALR